MKFFRIFKKRPRCNRWIEVVDVERQSATSVWINRRRHAKESEYYLFVETFSEAKTLLVVMAEQKERSLRAQLVDATAHAAAMRTLTEPA